MQSLRILAATEHTDSVRDILGRYDCLSVRDLVAQLEQRTSLTYNGITLTRTNSAIQIQSQDGQQTKVDTSETNHEPEQREKLLNEIWDNMLKFLRDNWQDIKDGKIKAVDIGGALYGIAGAAILLLLAPLAGSKLLDTLLRSTFALSSQIGRYYGAAADDLVAILKGESDLTKRDMVGVMAAVKIAGTYFPGLGPVILLGGADAWTLTKEIGHQLGGPLESGIDEIGKVAEGTYDVATSVVDFVKSIFP